MDTGYLAREHIELVDGGVCPPRVSVGDRKRNHGLRACASTCLASPLRFGCLRARASMVLAARAGLFPGEGARGLVSRDLVSRDLVSRELVSRELASRPFFSAVAVMGFSRPPPGGFFLFPASAPAFSC